MNVRSVPSSSLNPCARPYDQRAAVSSSVPPASTFISPMMTPVHAGQHLSSFASFLLCGSTCSLHMPVLRPASQVGPMCNPRDGTSVV